MKPCEPGGGGHSGTEWLPNARRPRGSGECQYLGTVSQLLRRQKKEGGQLQIKNLIRVVTCQMCLLLLYFAKYIMFITSPDYMKCSMEELESPLYIILY